MIVVAAERGMDIGIAMAMERVRVVRDGTDDELVDIIVETTAGLADYMIGFYDLERLVKTSA